MEATSSPSSTNVTRLAEMKIALKARLAVLDNDIDSLILKQGDEGEAADLVETLKVQIDRSITTLMKLSKFDSCALAYSWVEADIGSRAEELRHVHHVSEAPC
jgi:hypothetical protein